MPSAGMKPEPDPELTLALSALMAAAAGLSVSVDRYADVTVMRLGVPRPWLPWRPERRDGANG